MKNKKPLTAIAERDVVTLKSGDKTVEILVSELNNEKISDTFNDLGYVDEEPAKIVSVDREGNGALTIRTDKKKITINCPWKTEELNKGFNELGITADSYISFLEELQKSGLPSPINSNRISGGFPEELTLPNLNRFDLPVENSKTIDPTLFADEALSIGSLYAFPEIDSVNLEDLFQFGKKKSK